MDAHQRSPPERSAGRRPGPAGWDGNRPLCGSATILTEAGLLAQRIAPGLFHQGKFGFENWYDFEPELWNQVREEAKAQRLEEPQAYLAGSDLDPKVIDMAAANITAAGLEDCIRHALRRANRGGGRDGRAPTKPP